MNEMGTSANLRAIVTQVVREVIENDRTSLSAHTRDSEVSNASRGHTYPGKRALNTSSIDDTRYETVRITNDRDLQAFVYQVLELFENPKSREELRNGQLRFRLTGGVAAPAAPGAIERVEKGAITERKVEQAASAGIQLVIGRRAVLTPLARERARALGVLIEKEQ